MDMDTVKLDNLSTTLNDIRNQGLFKEERVITSPQGAKITVAPGREVINMCANNYLGLGNHPRLIDGCQAGARYAWFWVVIGKVHLRNAGPA